MSVLVQPQILNMSAARTENHEPAPGDTFANMKPNSLYILLYGDHNERTRFHWGLYDFCNHMEGGWKFDIIGPNFQWRTSIPYTPSPNAQNIDDTYEDGPLACTIRVGDINHESREQIHGLITAEDDRLRRLNADMKGTLNCRVYVWRACERLRSDGYVGYSKWEDLEREVFELGERCRERAGKQPVVVVDSNVATKPSS